MRRLKHIIIGSVLLLGGFISACAVAEATGFFEGKTIIYIVATKPGGGYDTYARLIARSMERHLPNTKIRIRNVPGAGNIVGANQLFSAKPDGLTIGTFNTGLIYAQLLKKQGIRFDLRAFSWIGKASSDPRVLIASSKSNLQTIRDFQTSNTALLFGTPGLGSASHSETVLLNNILGIRARLVPGLSANERKMSMMRGEIQASLGSYSTSRSFIKNGYGRYILHIGGEDIISDEVTNIRALVDRDAAELLSMIETVSALGRLTAAPPGVPENRLAVLREAYRRALQDPQLIADAVRLNLPIKPLFGTAVAARIEAALNHPPERFIQMTSLAEQH